MRKLDYEDLQEGMVLATAIYDSISGNELLSAGTKLTLRHIRLLRNQEIRGIEILDAQDSTIYADSSYVDDVLSQVLKEVNPPEELLFEPAERNIVNRNMEVNVLTGEGNIPIDVKHEVAIEDTKGLFEEIKGSGELDLHRIESNLISALPDFVRNNDVLMRLNQLKRTDNYTFEHSMRVSILATMIGKWLGFSQHEMLEVSEAGMLYDIGTLSVPEGVLNKPNTLTKEERELIRRHPQVGYSILLRTKGVNKSVKYAALHHHERLDGSGYPLRLRGNQIHYFAKIIAVCDVFDALTTDRPYREKMSPMLALDYIIWNSGKLFDTEIVYVFIQGLLEFFVGKECLLNNGKRGKIVFMDKNAPTRPVVQIGKDFVDLRKERQLDVEQVL